MSCLYWLYCMYSYNSSPCFLLVTCRLDGRTRFSTLSRRNTYWQCAHWKYVIEYRGRWLVHHHEAFNFGGCLEPPPPSPAKIYIPGSKLMQMDVWAVSSLKTACDNVLPAMDGLSVCAMDIWMFVGRCHGHPGQMFSCTDTTGWFKLNGGNLFLGQSTHRFFGQTMKFCTRLLRALTKA